MIECLLQAERAVVGRDAGPRGDPLPAGRRSRPPELDRRGRACPGGPRTGRRGRVAGRSARAAARSTLRMRRRRRLVGAPRGDPGVPVIRRQGQLGSVATALGRRGPGPGRSPRPSLGSSCPSARRSPEADRSPRNPRPIARGCRVDQPRSESPHRRRRSSPSPPSPRPARPRRRPEPAPRPRADAPRLSPRSPRPTPDRHRRNAPRARTDTRRRIAQLGRSSMSRPGGPTLPRHAPARPPGRPEPERPRSRSPPGSLACSSGADTGRRGATRPQSSLTVTVITDRASPPSGPPCPMPT